MKVLLKEESRWKTSKSRAVSSLALESALIIAVWFGSSGSVQSRTQCEAWGTLRIPRTSGW